MNILETIFTQPPAGCEEIRLSCRVYFQPVAQYILTGWLHVGSTDYVERRHRERLAARSF